MDIEIREFITYLHNRKRTSHNTEVSYQRDLKKMAAYFEERGIYDIRDNNNATLGHNWFLNIANYLHEIKKYVIITENIDTFIKF